VNDPWFNPNAWAWIPGTLLGVLGGTWGALAGTLAPRGRARRPVLGAGLLLLLLAMLSGVAGVAALFVGQPYGVWYGLLLPSVIGGFVLGPLLPLVARRYREAEGRKITAEDLSG